MANLVFSIAALKQALGGFGWEKPTPQGFVFEQYLDFYSLRFAPSCEHSAGMASLGGYEVSVHVWRPAATAVVKGTLFIVHGYFDHTGLYTHVIRWALASGLCVVAYDLPGHGLSSGPMAGINDFEEYQAVLKDLIQLCDGQVPEPWFAVGQSTGGGILFDYLLQSVHEDNSPKKQVFSHVVALAPLLRVTSWAAVTTTWQLLHRFQPSVPRGFGLNSHDQAFMNFQKYEDPLQSRVVSTDWVGAMIRWSRDMLERAPCPLASPLIIQGEEDTTVDFEFNLPVFSEKFPKATALRLPEARHHLVNESSQYREQIFETMAEFLGL